MTPEGSPPALDHLVLPCDDLDEARRHFETLGFTVGRRNRHPWGTENHIVQFPGAFLELIALAHDFVALSPDDGAFPFAGFLAGQGTSTDPSGMIVLRAEDAAAAAARFQEQGIGAGRMLDFSRSGHAPDGTTRTVAFALAFADAPALPDLGFFVCQQHFPENFWNPALQRHPNGVVGIGAVVIAASDPAPAAMFLSRFAGRPNTPIPEGGATIALADGTELRVERAATMLSPRLAGIGFVGGDGPLHAKAFGALRLTFRPGTTG